MRLPLKQLPERYAFADPSAGKQQVQVTLCKSAIIVIGVDAIGRIFVLKAWADRCSTDRFVEEIYRTQDEWGPRIFGIEANAMQSLFADMLKRERRKQQALNQFQKRVSFTAVKQSTKVDKDFRVRTALQPLVSCGELIVEESQVELVNQIATFPQCETKDLIDALASAVKLVPQRRTRQRKDIERRSEIQYLRETGAPDWYIEERLRAA